MRWIIGLGALTIAGCTAKAPISQAPVAMNFSNAARQAAVTGLNVSEVRARLRTDDGRAELRGVPCRLTGPGYTANFTTPAALQLPVFGNTAPQLALSCQYEGETRTTTISARNLTQERRDEARRDFLDRLSDGDGDGVNVGVRINLSFPRRPGGFDEFRYEDETLTFVR